MFWMDFTILRTSTFLSRQICSAFSSDSMPLAARKESICAIRLSYPSNKAMVFSLFLAGVDGFDGVGKAAIGAGCLGQRGLRIHALGNGVHHGSEPDELVADDLVVRVESQFRNVALGQLKIARSLFCGAVHRSGHAAQAFAQIFQAGADGQ